MKGLRYCGSAFLVVAAGLALGCKAKEAVVTTPPPPPAGFKNVKMIPRHDDAGGTIDVYLAIGDSAIIVNSSTPPASDVALGWISNSGTKKEKVYGFRPSDKATYKLFARSQGNGGGWRIEEDPTGGGPTDPNWKTGQFTVCDTHNAGVPDVGFKNCGGAGGGGTVSSTSSSMAMTSHASMTGGFLAATFRRVLGLFQAPGTDLDAPGWAACTDGCCTW